MKRIIALLLCLCIACSLAACGQDNPANNDTYKGSVADTQSPGKDDDGDKGRNYLAGPGITYDAGGLAITFAKLEKIESSKTISHGAATEVIDTSEWRLHYKITNTSDIEKSIMANAFAINGVTIDTLLMERIAAGEMAENYLSFSWFDFDYVQIKDIKNIKCPTAKIYTAGQETVINVNIEFDCGNMDYEEDINLLNAPVYDANSIGVYVVDVERMNTISRTVVTLAVVNAGNSFAEITADSFVGNGTAVEKIAEYCYVHAGSVAYMEVEWSASEVDALGGYLENFSFVAHIEDDNGATIDKGTKVTVDFD
jgi:hypothetical protein